jgi:large subunit ribosomal protein L32
MTAHPKRRTTRSKRDLRRIHDNIKTGAIVLCNHCRRPHLDHHICPNCGFYKGREIELERPNREIA